MKVSTQITLCALLYSYSLSAQTVFTSIEVSKTIHFFDLDASILTATCVEELGLVEVCFDSLPLHPEVPHYLIFPEGKVENEVVTNASVAIRCLYFDVGYAIDLIALDERSQVVVTVLEVVRSQ